MSKESKESKETKETKVTRRNYLKWAGGAVVAAAVVAGAGYYGYQAMTPKQIKISQTIHSIDVNGTMAGTAKAWNAAHPDIPLVQYFGSTSGGAVADYHRSMVELAQSKSPDLDIFNGDVIWGNEFGTNGYVLQLDDGGPLGDMFPASDQADFIPSMINAWTVKGHIYAVPWMTDIGALWYRKDILDKEGITPPPDGWEWTEFFKICQDLKAKYPGMDGLAEDNAQEEQMICNWQEFLASNGGDFFDENGLIRINDSVAVDALQMMVDMIQKYKITTANTLTSDLDTQRAWFVDKGNAIFHRNWNYVWGTSLASTSAVNGKVWVSPLPHFTGHASAHCCGGWSWAISEGSAHPEQAWEVVKYFTNRDTMKTIMLNHGWTQARLSLVTDPDVAKIFPIFPAYVNLYKTGTIRPKLVNYMALSDIEQPQIHAALSGTKSAKDALDAIADGMSKLLGVGISTK